VTSYGPWKSYDETEDTGPNYELDLLFTSKERARHYLAEELKVIKRDYFDDICQITEIEAGTEYVLSDQNNEVSVALVTKHVVY